ncbi:DUF2182 domain-containing protein [Ramlibacter sp. MMS24-I3-19]|uniref:DUF2182 domain-containing protein n=1 Tax=Ramlibacter sp. MMS24-I3-19 TaxID=3416606 RepID=UPI003CFE4E9B
MLQAPGSPADGSAALGNLVREHPGRALAVSAISIAGWVFLAWLALDMGTPLAQLAMPMSAHWSAGNLLAVWAMWAVMMVAMMLPSALPMILTFTVVAHRSGQATRARAFVGAYLLVWLAFASAGTLGQWLLQRLGAVDPMRLATSALPAAVLLVLAGVYQFSPLKRVCLRSCRTPLAFLLGAWRPGVVGAFEMGLRHGLLCLGCCWALMALLFVGGVMNVPWVAALAVAVAIEKMAPGGERIAGWLGVALLLAGGLKLLALAA